MKLLIDIGNTRSKLVKVKSSTCEIQPTDIVHINTTELNEQYFSRHWQDISTIVMASVSNENNTKRIANWASANQIKLTTVSTEPKRFGVTSAYVAYQNLGVDRWLALIAAQHLFPEKNVLIIDSGTATTFDLLSNKSEHIGGWIVPGINLLYDALMTNTASINAQMITTPALSFGKGSSDCVNNGIWAMALGSINQSIVEAEKLAELDQIIFCGGNGKALLSLLSHEKSTLVEALVVTGLQRYIDV